MGTIGLVTPDAAIYGSLTTPDPVDLHRTLGAEIAGAGVTRLAMEASSPDLDQHRLDGVRVTVASFAFIARSPRLSPRLLEAYLAAKLILFERIVRPDGAASSSLRQRRGHDRDRGGAPTQLDVMTVGRNGDGIRLVEGAIDGFAQTLRHAHGRTRTVRLPLVGGFQVENALVAAGQAIASGGQPAAVFAAARAARRRKAETELVGRRSGAPIFVDLRTSPTRSPRRSRRCGPM